MGNPITAEQHNETRRANKARKLANRKANKQKTISGPPIGGRLFEQVYRDRERRERMLAAKKHNEDRLISIVLTRGILVLRCPHINDMDADFDYIDFKSAQRRFEMDVNDVKNAAKARPSRFQWHTTENGDFCIALPKGSA